MSGLAFIAAAISVFTGIGAGISIGKATCVATESVARQPEAASAIYGLVVALMILSKI